MLLNEYTHDEINKEIEQKSKTNGTPILHLENHGIPNYQWSVERTNKVIANCFEEDQREEIVQVVGFCTIFFGGTNELSI